MFRPRFIALLLALVTLLVYLPVTRDAFLDFDDDDYVTGNPVVQGGLTWSGVKWAFTTGHAGNWHPITWLSHMTDCEIFGLDAGAHHLINVLFHASNVVLLLVLLRRLGGGLWPCAFVAALFAWHPLHVESVAWVSERKDVLSTFFALLTLLCYTRFVEESKVRSPKSKVFYVLAMAMFALGLMSKPMLVTLPFVMLLLDYWPLGRFPPSAFRLPFFLRFAVEKWPFFLLAAVSCVVTFLVQRNGNAVVPLESVPLSLRLENGLTAYALYLLKTVWPVNLAAFYPFPKHIPATAVFASLVLLTAISLFVWRMRRVCPYLLMGWLWYLGTLVPVIGLVQVGGAAMADRYTYFPLIGIFIAVTFGACDLAKRFQFPKIIPSAAAAVILAACLILTENQLRWWRDSVLLFTRVLAVAGNNDVAHIDLGVALEQQGRPDEAMLQYREALRLNPDRYQTRGDLGNLLDKLGKPREAIAQYRDAIRLKPDLPSLHDNLGTVLAELGRFNEATNEFDQAARLDPGYPWPHLELGKVLLQQGRDAGAISQFREALRLDPENFQTLAYIAHVLAAEENPEIRDGPTALQFAAKANALTGGQQPLVLDAFGMACAEAGRFDEAGELTQKAVHLAEAAGMKKGVIAAMEQRLQLYKNHQPWRESFLFTNAPPAELPKN